MTNLLFCTIKNPFKGLFWLYLFFFCHMCITCTLAEEPAAGRKDVTEMSLEELMNIPVYAASKRAQTVSEAPSFVTIVTREEIKRYGYRTLSDVIRSVPGFYVSSDRNYDYTGTRGFSRPGDYNTRILTLLNGLRLNDNVYDANYTDRVFPVSIEQIERVEIIRGPASSLYGTSALFAVINVITIDPAKSKGGQVSAEAGSFGSTKGNISYSYLFDGGAAMQIAGTLFNTPGQELYFKEFDTPQTNNGKTSRRCDEEAEGNLFMMLNYKDLAFQAGISSRDKNLPTSPWGSVFNDPGVKTRDTMSFVDTRLEHSFSKNLTAMGRLSYLNYGYDGWYVYEQDPVRLPGSTYGNKDIVEGEWWIGEVKITSEAIERNKITAGTEYRLNTRQLQQNIDEDADSYNLNDKRHSSTWALFVEDEIRLYSRLLLNVGARYDHYETFGGETHPRAALIYQPLSDTTIKMVYGSAFRAPNSYELFYTDLISQKGNIALDSEKISTYELILEQNLGRRTKAIISGYHYNIRDLIDQQTDPADGLIQFNNISSATANGIDLALQGRTRNDIDWKTSYSINDTYDDDTHEQLSNSPRHIAKANISSPLLSPKLIGSLETQYMSCRRTLTGAHSEDVFLVNTTILSRHLAGFELSLSVYNIFDYKYGDPGAAEHPMDLIMQDGTTFRVKATYTF